MTVLRDAITAVPAVKYALGVLGIVAAIAIVKSFGINYRVAVYGTIIMIVLMVALLVFAALTKAKSPQVQVAALIMMWSFLVLTVLTATLLFTSAFFRYPKPLPEIFGMAGVGTDRMEFDRRLDQAWDALGGAPNTHVITDFSTPNIEEARRALRDARNLKPHDAAIYLVEAAVSFAMGSRDSAEKSLREGLHLSPDDWDLQYNLGWLLASQAKYDEAINAYERAAKLDPKSPHPHYGLAMVHKAQGKLEEAVKCFRACLALDPTDAQAHFFLAQTLIDLNDSAHAVQEYAEAVKWAPDNPKYRYELSQQYIAQDQLDLARGELEEAVRIAPNGSANAYINLGTIYAMDGKFDKAENALRNAVRLDPTSAKGFANLGNSLSAQGNLQDAIAAYQRSIAIAPSAAAYYNLGMAFEKVGKTNGAIGAYRQAVALNPNYGRAYREQGRLLFQQKQNQDAIKQLAEAVKLSPDDPYVHNYYGIVLADEKRFDEAVREFREAVRLKPDFKEAQSNIELAVQAQAK